jgi:hypothetical protein
MKYPIDFELNPDQIEKGQHWVTLNLKNMGNETVENLDVNLHSLDSLSLSVLGTGKFLMDLKPNEEEVVPFQVSATTTTRVYASVSGYKDGEYFYCESPTIRLKVGREVADLTSLFVMTEPYPPSGKTLRCEATILGLQESEGLDLGFWAEAPSGEFTDLARIETKRLALGEEARYAAEITPREAGLYTVTAYLYDNYQRIGRETDYVYVQK